LNLISLTIDQQLAFSSSLRFDASLFCPNIIAKVKQYADQYSKEISALINTTKILVRRPKVNPCMMTAPSKLTDPE
jgi:hypothetical protein